MNRRLALLGGTAVAAAAAGAGVAWWRTQARGGGDGAAIWPMRFDRPDGGNLALAGLRGKPLLLNFWATWCPPCVSELPLIDRFYREQQARGWQVVGLAVDNLAPVREFLGKRPVSFAVGLAGLEGVALSRSLGNAGGALPFSVVFDRAGTVAQRRLGVIQPEDLQRWVGEIG
jgi:thiol-disulfide isomerase/thioredoxin